MNTKPFSCRIMLKKRENSSVTVKSSGNNIVARSFRTRQRTSRAHGLNLKFLKNHKALSKHPRSNMSEIMTASKKSAHFKIFKFDYSSARNRKPSVNLKKDGGSKHKGRNYGHKTIQEDYDREDIFLPYNETFQLRDYLEYESEEEPQPQTTRLELEEMNLALPSHW
ncbi:unnamed protein product [Moneuplotes crassus]|uniref:Uncharacterized protein n=1 Tax=Euplotes crassus TaxID=5936 RepID=A0AAD1UBB8_EUPCR|nr:unnamed protein product [Moneuplotes crassus]